MVSSCDFVGGILLGWTKIALYTPVVFPVGVVYSEVWDLSQAGTYRGAHHEKQLTRRSLWGDDEV